ncbi:hypothetical protein D8B23_11710 [Verminephrobacter aporrectodeae subsp. tuberculatae]|uniref:DUF6776 family protein n=1 Tax=Verminephrobacter aporrectodeae TaxID=1110389 RepID=UPI002237A510|nr:DUF6776 family protein [Verminephrobacter aporrectodeae]MCW5255776.1 hypothetical protein [Verminephrobacter aporrectodeae subsp. tuberculatae]MCW8199074.1 hypothetical protein [Verminephrobacter aporrectodeae subsp. tuberculatae]
MRFRLLRHRLTISAPRVAVRSALPWPFRWLALAVLLGLCAVAAFRVFDSGKPVVAKLDAGTRAEWLALRSELASLHEQERQRQAVALTAESLLAAERAAKESLLAQVRQLQADNQTLREDLGFFEKLIPAAKTQGPAIRALQAEVLAGMQLRWQVLVIQATRNAPDFNGSLELMLAGTRDGRPWTQTLPPQGQPLQLRQYRRVEGVFDLPPNTVVKTVTARVLEGTAVRAVQTMALK